MPSQRGWFFGRKGAQDPGTQAAGLSPAAWGETVPVPAPEEVAVEKPEDERNSAIQQGPATDSDTPASSPAKPVLAEVPVDLVTANPYQPRTSLESDESLSELAESIKSHGVLQPILVTRRGGAYVLVAGERRWRAAALAGLTAIPALVGEFGPRELAEDALIENLQRRDLSCLEEAEAFRRLLGEFNLTQEELAGRLGRSQPVIANKLRLLRLPESIREGISREMISEGHARALLALDSSELQELALGEIVHRGLSVRQTEELVRGMLGRPAPGQRKPHRQVVRVFKDARLFRNSLLSLVSQMKRGGAAVELEETAGTDFYEVHLKVRRHPESAEKSGGGAAAGGSEGSRRSGA